MASLSSGGRWYGGEPVLQRTKEARYLVLKVKVNHNG